MGDQKPYVSPFLTTMFDRLKATPQTTNSQLGRDGCTSQMSSSGSTPIDRMPQLANSGISILEPTWSHSSTSSQSQASKSEGDSRTSAMSSRSTADRPLDRSSISTKGQVSVHGGETQKSPMSMLSVVETPSTGGYGLAERDNSVDADNVTTSNNQLLKSKVATLQVHLDPGSSSTLNSQTGSSALNTHKIKRGLDADSPSQGEGESHLETPASKKIKSEPANDDPRENLARKNNKSTKGKVEVNETEARLNRGWCKKEREMLVRMASEQLLLESVDKEKVIPWKKLWEKVSSALDQAGYQRSVIACRGYWDRYQKAQEASNALLNDREEQHSSLGMTGERNEILTMSSSAISAPFQSDGFLTQFGQESRSTSKNQAQEESPITNSQLNTKQTSTRGSRYLVVGTLKGISDVLVYASGRKQRNVDREKIKLFVTEEAAKRHSLDLLRPLQDRTEFYAEFLKSSWEEIEGVILTQFNLRRERVEKNMICPKPRSSMSQRTPKSQVSMHLPDVPARSVSVQQGFQYHQQISQASPISGVAEYSIIGGEQDQQSVQSGVQRQIAEPLPEFHADVSITNMDLPQQEKNIEDDEQATEEDEDLESFIADTGLAREGAIQAAMRYGHSTKNKQAILKKEMKLLRLQKEDLACRETSINEQERNVERKTLSIATQENILKQRENSVTQSELRILQEEQNLNNRARELEAKEIERSQLLADMEEFPARVKAATMGVAASPIEPPRQLDLKGMSFDTAFEAIPKGCPDAGTFRQKIGFNITLNGKYFEEFQYLTPISELVVDGQPDGKSFNHRFRSYSHYTKDDTEKMVQKLIPECLIQYQGNYFIRRLVLREIERDKSRDFSI